MIPKSGNRFPPAKPCQYYMFSGNASAGKGRSDKIMLKQKAKARLALTRFSAGVERCEAGSMAHAAAAERRVGRGVELEVGYGA